MRWLVLALACVAGTVHGQIVAGGGIVGNLATRLQTGTFANVPSASQSGAGALYFATNYGVKGATLVSDGTRWKPLNGCAVLSTLDAPSSAIANTETVVFQATIPAAALTTGDRLRVFSGTSKSGTTDNLNMIIRLGTSGTTADASSGSLAILVTTQISGQTQHDVQIRSATTAVRTGGNPVGFAIGVTAYPTPFTISNVSNQLILSVTIASSGATNTVKLEDGQIMLCTSGN